MRRARSNFFNRQVLEYFGKTTEELRNWATSDVVHPNDLPRVTETWKRSIETGQPYVLELRQRVPTACTAGSNLVLSPRETRKVESRLYMLLTDIDAAKEQKRNCTGAKRT